MYRYMHIYIFIYIYKYVRFVHVHVHTCTHMYAHNCTSRLCTIVHAFINRGQNLIKLYKRTIHEILYHVRSHVKFQYHRHKISILQHAKEAFMLFYYVSTGCKFFVNFLSNIVSWPVDRYVVPVPSQ